MRLHPTLLAALVLVLGVFTPSVRAFSFSDGGVARSPRLLIGSTQYRQIRVKLTNVVGDVSMQATIFREVEGSNFYNITRLPLYNGTSMHQWMNLTSQLGGEDYYVIGVILNGEDAGTLPVTWPWRFALKPFYKRQAWFSLELDGNIFRYEFNGCTRCRMQSANGFAWTLNRYADTYEFRNDVLMTSQSYPSSL